MVAEVEVLEFNNKINKEVKMFLVVLSSDIKASWNWCQKPQALKKMQGLNRDSYFKPSWKWESEFYTTSLMFSENVIARKRPPPGERQAFQDWLVKHMHSNVTGERECFLPHIWEKKAIMQKGKCFHNKRWETAPAPAIDAEDNQALGKLQTDGEDRQHGTRTTFPHESQT